MDLCFLGRGSAFNHLEKNTSAYIRQGGNLLLLDCGETVFGELNRRGVLKDTENIYLVLSHLHTDHCGSLSSLALYCHYMLHTKLKIALPDHPGYRAQVQALLDLLVSTDPCYELISAASLPAMGSFRSLRYVQTAHSPNMLCFSFEIETAEGWIFYSGDHCYTVPLERFMAEHPDFLRIYTDACDTDYPGNVHLYIGRLAACVPGADRSRVRLMHVNNDRCVEEGRKLGFETVRAEP